MLQQAAQVGGRARAKGGQLAIGLGEGGVIGAVVQRGGGRLGRRHAATQTVAAGAREDLAALLLASAAGKGGGGFQEGGDCHTAAARLLRLTIVLAGVQVVVRGGRRQHLQGGECHSGTDFAHFAFSGHSGGAGLGGV